MLPDIGLHYAQIVVAERVDAAMRERLVRRYGGRVTARERWAFRLRRLADRLDAGYRPTPTLQ